MTRESEARLLAFCTAQRRSFAPEAWLSFPHPRRDELATTALFLAHSSWYGHGEALQTIAQALQAPETSCLPEMIERTRFDCPRFSHMLRRALEHVDAAS